MPSTLRAEMRPIVLVGFMCSGKTTLGRAVASALSAEFVDLDEHIESTEGCSVADIFAAKGEEYFRKLERETLDRLIDGRAGNRRRVIALGGGTPCRPGVMQRLNESATTVHLEVPVERIVERILLEPGKRPLADTSLGRDALTDRLSALLTERNPFYRQALLAFDASRLENEEQIAESTRQFLSLLDRTHSLQAD